MLVVVGKGYQQKRGNQMLDFITDHSQEVRNTLWKIADARFEMRFDFGLGYELFVNLNEDYDFRFFENDFVPNKFVAYLDGGTDETSGGFAYDVEPTRRGLLEAYAKALRIVEARK
jgi:hypothetical protein